MASPVHPARLREIAAELLRRAQDAERRSEVSAIEDRLMHSLMDDDAVRVQGLRFVDVLPALTTDAQLVDHLEAYLGDHPPPIPLPGLSKLTGLESWVLRHAKGRIASHVIAALVRSTVGRMARRFIAGADADTAAKRVRKLWDQGMGFTLDLLGEATVSEAEAQAYQRQVLALLDAMSQRVEPWPRHEVLETISCRPCPRYNQSIKMSSLFSQLDPVDFAGSVEAIKQRVRPILLRARQLGVFINLDMEQYDTKAVTIAMFKSLLMEPELRDWPNVGIALQAYLRDTEQDIRDLIGWARTRGTPVTVRLVRGAYWDYETVIARQNGWAIPVFTTKRGTDDSYSLCLTLLLANHPIIETAAATHNLRSLAEVIALAEQHGLSPTDYELQMLYGMADPLKHALVEMQQRLRVYVPFGELLPGMAYLVRRLLENTSSQSFVRMGFAQVHDLDAAIALPDEPRENTAMTKPVDTSIVLPPFRNEPWRRFTDEAERNAMQHAIDYVRGQLGVQVDMLIAGTARSGATRTASLSPANPGVIVGHIAEATASDVKDAINAASDALSTWRDTPAAERAQYLVRAAAWMRERREELAAWEVFEAAKPWREADADVTEAIDFLEYYARQMIALSNELNLDVPGETNRYFYQPRGVAAIIAPWNFPLAIVTGMAAAAIVTGNTAVVKPAPQTPVIASKLVEAFTAVGLPRGVLNFVPGGDDVGKALVSDARTAIVAFTGSLAAGASINVEGAKLQPGQHHVKRIIAEMGGKNAIVIDHDADLDDAVRGTIRSAFGYAGQKCSACSRVIVIDDTHDLFVKRLVEAAASLSVGDPADAATLVPPVIDDEALQRIRSAIDVGRTVAKVVHESDVTKLATGHYVGPTIFDDVPPDSALAQEEIFGPVLAVMRADNFEHAIELANNTRFALTGGVYSRHPRHLEYARRYFRVGNLYFNRGITGSIVGRQPFGGFKLSGIGSKAGGPDYLLQFMEPRVVTENTIRRGFAPEDD